MKPVKAPAKAPKIASAIEIVAMSSVKKYPDNIRLHSQENIDAIKRSLSAFGQTKPIVVWKNLVIAGNGTYQSAAELEWQKIGIVRVDHLSEAEAKTYAIADNKTSDLSDFDYQKLSEQLRELSGKKVDLTLTGFRDFEVEPLLQAEWAPPDIQDGDISVDNLHIVKFTAEQWAIVSEWIGEAKDEAAAIAEALTPANEQA